MAGPCAVCRDRATTSRRLTLEQVRYLAEVRGLDTPPVSYRIPVCERCFDVFDEMGIAHEPVPREDMSTMIANRPLQHLRYALDRLDLGSLEPVNRDS